MINIIKRFFHARGGFRWRLLYALEHEREIYNREYFATHRLEPGEFFKVTKYGNLE